MADAVSGRESLWSRQLSDDPLRTAVRILDTVGRAGGIEPLSLQKLFQRLGIQVVTMPQDGGPGVFVTKPTELIINRGLQWVGELVQRHEWLACG